LTGEHQTMATAVAMPSAAAAQPSIQPSTPAKADQEMKKAETTEAVVSRVTVRTPQIHWHGKNPVFAVDFHPTFPRLCATGGSEPDGSGGVHLWLMNEGETAEQSPVDFVQDLQGHEKTVNCLRFSPNGELLASAGVEGAVVIWRRATIATSAANAKAGGERWEYLTMLRAHVLDVCDLSWSPSSQQVVTACVDNTAAVFSVFGKEKVSAHIRGHDHFVLGVAWDPAEEYILTISSDRTCRLHTSVSRKWKADCRVAHVARSMEFPEKNTGPTVLQMVPQNHVLSPEEAANKKARDFKLFLDDTLCAHRRRPAWSPDGIFAVVPGGVHQASSSSPQTFVTHLISRRNPTKPFAFLPAGKQPTVAVRFCPIGFKLRQKDGEPVDPGSLPTPEKLSMPRKNPISSPFNMAYRMLFAVASLDSVAVYDTQQMGKPLLHVRGIHFTPLTDLSWSNDGRLLVATSSDGYCTIIEFAPGELGEAMEIPLATVARSKTKDDGPGGAAEEAEANAKAAAPAPAPAQAAVPPQTAAAASANKAGEKGEGEAKGAEEAASKKRRIIPKVVNNSAGDGASTSAGASSTVARPATDVTAEDDNAGSSNEPIVLEDSQDAKEAPAQEEAMQVEEGAGGPAREGAEGSSEKGEAEKGDAEKGAAAGAQAAAPASDTDKQAPKKRRIVPSVVTPAASAAPPS